MVNVKVYITKKKDIYYIYIVLSENASHITINVENVIYV